MRAYWISTGKRTPHQQFSLRVVIEHGETPPKVGDLIGVSKSDLCEEIEVIADIQPDKGIFDGKVFTVTPKPRKSAILSPAICAQCKTRSLPAAYLGGFPLCLACAPPSGVA